MSRSRNWCFTINNFTAEDCTAVAAWKCRGVAYAEEVGASGTPHIQGYVAFKEAVTLGSAKKVHASAHWEPTRGTSQQNLDYIQKGEQSHAEWVEQKTAGPNYGKNLKGFVQVGEFPTSVDQQAADQKRKWEEALSCVKEGRLEDLDPMLKATRLRSLKYAVDMEAAQKFPRKALDGELEHLWIHGIAGSGKSSHVFKTYPDAYIRDPNERWWDGYTGQDTVIIDDVDDDKKVKKGDLKRWGDRYPFQAPVKGGYHLIRPRRVIVTSQYKPEDIWTDKPTREALARRYKLVEFTPSDQVLSLDPGELETI